MTCKTVQVFVNLLYSFESESYKIHEQNDGFEIPDYVKPAATFQQRKPFYICVPKFGTIIWKKKKEQGSQVFVLLHVCHQNSVLLKSKRSSPLRKDTSRLQLEWCLNHLKPLEGGGSQKWISFVQIKSAPQYLYKATVHFVTHSTRRVTCFRQKQSTPRLHCPSNGRRQDTSWCQGAQRRRLGFCWNPKYTNTSSLHTPTPYPPSTSDIESPAFHGHLIRVQAATSNQQGRHLSASPGWWEGKCRIQSWTN